MKTHGLQANLIFNLAGTISPIVITVITLPIYISHIGTARYGLVSIVWILLGYFGFLDLGLSRATANALAKFSTGVSTERSRIFLTAFWVNLSLGTVGAAIIFFISVPVLGHLITMPPGLKPEVEAALPWISCLLPIAMVSGVGVGILESRERFLVLNILQIAGTVIGQAVPALCAVFISPSLAFVIPAAVLARVFSICIILGFVMRDEWPLDLLTFDRKRCRELLGYGGWVSVSNFINPLLSSLDQIVIGSVLGVSAVAHYSVPMSIVGQSQTLAVALSRTLFPKMSRFNNVEAKRLTEKALVTLSYAFGSICASSIILAPSFLVLWMGKEFAQYATPVVELLLIGGWINGLAFLPHTLLQGQGRPDITAKFHALELIPFVVFLWLFANWFGLIGAATAWVFRVTADGIFLFVAARFEYALLRSFLIPGACIVISYLSHFLMHLSLVGSLFAAAVVGVIPLIASVILDRSTREFILQIPALRRAIERTKSTYQN